jgi:hypothetical protein
VTPAPPSTPWLSQLDTADRQPPTEALAAKVRLTEKLTKLKEEMGKLVLASLDRQISLTDPDRRSMERARLRRRRLQRAGRRRYRAPSDRDARDDEQRLRSAQLANKASRARCSRPWPIAATSVARRSSPATRTVSPRAAQAADVGRQIGGCPSHVDAAVLALAGLTAICAIEDTIKTEGGLDNPDPVRSGRCRELCHTVGKTSGRSRDHDRRRVEPALR